MDHITDRLISNINLLMQHKGVTNVTELAKKTRIPQPTMHRLVTGGIKDPKYTLLKCVANYFKVTVEELVENDLTKTKPVSSDASNFPELCYLTQVPVVGGVVQLGSGGKDCVILQSSVGNDGFINWPTRDPKAFSLRCSDDSMQPRIKDGEYIVIEPNYSYLPGDEVLILTKDEQVMVKTFLYERNTEIMVMSINEENFPIRFALKNIKCIQYIAGIAKPSLHISN